MTDGLINREERRGKKETGGADRKGRRAGRVCGLGGRSGAVQTEGEGSLHAAGRSAK